MRLVVVESPWAAADVKTEAKHLRYAIAAMRDSLARREAPMASHVLYAASGILDDQIPKERAEGIAAGLAWSAKADLIAAYIDLGISPGMKVAIERAEQEGIPVEYRSVPIWTEVGPTRLSEVSRRRGP